MRPMLAACFLAAALCSAGCGPSPCDQAATRIRACFKSANCSTLTNPDAKTACTAGQSSTLTGSTGDCSVDELAAANLINGCAALDPEQLCAACQQ